MGVNNKSRFKIIPQIYIINFNTLLYIYDSMKYEYKVYHNTVFEYILKLKPYNKIIITIIHH